MIYIYIGKSFTKLIPKITFFLCFFSISNPFPGGEPQLNFQNPQQGSAAVVDIIVVV